MRWLVFPEPSLNPAPKLNRLNQVRELFKWFKGATSFDRNAVLEFPPIFESKQRAEMHEVGSNLGLAHRSSQPCSLPKPCTLNLNLNLATAGREQAWPGPSLVGAEARTAADGVFEPRCHQAHSKARRRIGCRDRRCSSARCLNPNPEILNLNLATAGATVLATCMMAHPSQPFPASVRLTAPTH